MTAPHGLRAFVTRWELAWHAATVAVYASAVLVLVVAFPDVSNLWVSIFVLVGTLTSAVTAMIAALKQRGTE